MAKVLFIGEGTVTDNVRCKLPAMHLAKLGYETAYLELRFKDQSPLPDENFDLVIFSRPHHDSLMVSYKRLGVPVIVDMDDDFHAIPSAHPGYKFVGEGDMLYLAKLDNCMYLADKITVATENLKARLGAHNPNITVIPNGWSADNFNWMVKRSIHKDRFIFGWGGTITHRDDFKMCIGPIKSILKKYPQAMISIAGDLELYKHFINVPETQKLFMPMVDYYLYPVTLSLWDVLLAPLEDTYFNQAKSDIKLVDAGARGVPYIASNISIYQDWEGSGILVQPDGWYNAMEQLIEHPELCQAMSARGEFLARKREMTVVAELWKQTIEEYIHVTQEEKQTSSSDQGGENGVSVPVKETNVDSSNGLPHRRNKAGNKPSKAPKARAKKAAKK
jgi:glycosyltransferase involved in cell wall biosynthesis